MEYIVDMFRNNDTISTPEPCSKPWNSMAKVPLGRFCSQCQHDVIDFSKMSNDQILEYLSNNFGEKICGKINKTQIKSINKIGLNPTKSKRRLKTLVLGFILFIQSCISTKNSQPKQSQPFGEARITSISNSHPTKYLIHGHIMETPDQPIFSAAIYLDKTNLGTFTDFNGNFELELSKDEIRKLSNPKLIIQHLPDLNAILELDSLDQTKKLPRVVDIIESEICIGIIAYKQPWYKRFILKVKNIFT